MFLKKIELENFRNYSSCEIDFHEKINIITGENAQGKTNLLESIYFSSAAAVSTDAFSGCVNLHEIEFGSFVESFVFDIKKPPKIIAGGDIKTASLRRNYPVQVMRVRYKISISAKAPLAKTIILQRIL